jgi:hypothetical protein
MMVGRYINHEGKQFNRPFLRFGNLAMMPEDVWQEDLGRYQESFVVDMRSASGFSGSPVYVFFGDYGPRGVDLGPPMDLEDINKLLETHKWSSKMGPRWLLGVDWGHLPIPIDIWDPQTRKKTGEAVIHGGMSGVVPSWKITELLLDERLMSQIAKQEEKLAEVNPRAAVLDSTGPPSFDKSAFEDALFRATRITEPDESAPEGSGT